ncbi:MAG: GNAT family N-acetyltransferase [Clostridia bacterium]|nr:GNAT family N-acetyltransferase [Clostridia bacterium]
MKIITIDKNNLDAEHICCAIGNDKQNQNRAQTKKDWMKEVFDDGLVFKRFDQRGKIFIEYMPIEKAWKPISGSNYMLINCLWVSGQFKGKGLSTQLLNECIADTKAQKMDGIVVVSSSKVKPFLTDKKFYLKHGFEIVDTAPPYFELLVLKFNPKAKNPVFSANAKEGRCENKEGFTFIYSNQCPFMEEYVLLLSEIAKRNGMTAKIHKLQNYKEAQTMGSPFGTLGIYFKGAFQTHELMSENKFEKYIEGYKEAL